MLLEDLSSACFSAVMVQAEGWFDVDLAILGLAVSMLCRSCELNGKCGINLEYGDMDFESTLHCNPLDNKLILMDCPWIAHGWED